MFRVHFLATDGERQESRSFATLAGARNFARRMIGDQPDLNGDHAVSAAGFIDVDGLAVEQLFD